MAFLSLHPIALGVLIFAVIALAVLVFISSPKAKKVVRRRSQEEKQIAASHGHARIPLPGFAKAAAEEGNMRILQRWLNGINIDVDGKDISSGRTALHYAAKGGHSECVRLLLDAEADANIQDNEGETPLHITCRGGHGLATKLLLDKNAVPYLNNIKDETCLQLAEKYGHVGCARLIQLAALKDSQEKGNVEKDVTLRRLLHGSNSFSNV